MSRNVCLYILVGFFTVCFSALAEDSKVRTPVDVLLVMAVDVSSSITGETKGGGVNEYALQKAGITQALRDPELARVLEQCNLQGAALTYVEWSGSVQQDEVHQLTQWAHVRSGMDLQKLADQIDAISGRSSSGSTDIARAIQISSDLLDRSGFASNRTIISLSSDGQQNVALGRSPGHGRSVTQSADVFTSVLTEARDQAVARDIQINAIVLPADRTQDKAPNQSSATENNLRYYRENVIGGQGAFALPVESFRDYAEVFRKKLIRELNNCIS